MDQQDFDLTIGQLDRVLSKLVLWGESCAGTCSPELDHANQQTLKHHAEDMIGAGNKILKCLGVMLETPVKPDVGEILGHWSKPHQCQSMHGNERCCKPIGHGGPHQPLDGKEVWTHA